MRPAMDYIGIDVHKNQSQISLPSSPMILLEEKASCLADGCGSILVPQKRCCRVVSEGRLLWLG
jgi:hypothetical protein